jgi:hypothetical protein
MGVVHDYTRKAGIQHTEIIVPAAATWALNRSVLWNRAETAETRKNSTVAREFELALPSEISAQGRVDLARKFAEMLVSRYGIAADVAIHSPHRLGDRRNFHAHVLTTVRAAGEAGLAAKIKLLDRRETGPGEVMTIRALWGAMVNEALELAHIESRVDHRSLRLQRDEAEAVAARHRAAGDLAGAGMAEARAESLDRKAGEHAGPTTTNMERRAEREAREAGRQYRPVTDRGGRIEAARLAKDAAEAAFRQAMLTLAAAMKEWARDARDWLARARARAAIARGRLAANESEVAATLRDKLRAAVSERRRHQQLQRRRGRGRVPGDD